MRRNNVVYPRENAAHGAQVLAEIGRGLRDGYDAGQPLPDRLADLVRKIDQLPDRQSPTGSTAVLGAVQLADA